MRVVALIFGILAGLFGFGIAQLGHIIVGLGGGSNGALLYLLPLASLLGGGLAMQSPSAGAILLLGSGGLWLALGAQTGYAINFITITPVVLNVLGGLFALGDASARSADGRAGGILMPGEKIKIEKEPHRLMEFPVGQEPIPPTLNYDRPRWEALLKYDPDISAIAEKIKPMGQRWMDEFASSYLTLNDKQYLPEIIRKIASDWKIENEKKKHKDALDAQMEQERQILRDREQQLRVARRKFWKEKLWGSPAAAVATNGVIVGVIILVVTTAWIGFVR